MHNYKNLIAESRKIVITSHANPDGDAIGSSLALFHYLNMKQVEVKVVVPNKFPEFLAWLPGADQIHIYLEEKELCEKIITEADLVFCLDYNTLGRLENMKRVVGNCDALTFLIDHHPQPGKEFDYLISDINTSSTSELIYNFILDLGDKALINEDIAACLYTGIITDTGSFSYACNHPETYLVTSELIKTGIDGELIHRKVYDTYSEDRMRLLGYCLSEKLILKRDLHAAYISLTREELDRFNYQIGDTEGVVNYALAIKGINLAVLITERDSFIRLSFRSKGSFSVNKFARKYFNGGGHANAAGGNSYKSLKETIKILEKSLQKYSEQLGNAME